MYSIGIDCAKGKSTVCIIAIETGELIMSSRDYEHTEKDLEKLYETIKKLTGSKDVRVVMEATGIYHWPVLSFLKGKGLFVSVINPLKMKLFAKNYNFRGIKTDKYDALVIASYGAEKWFTLKDFNMKQDETREKLRNLSRVYESYQKPKIILKQNLDAQLEKTMPGIKKIITEDEKLYDFIEYFSHFDNISKLSEAKFTERLDRLAKKKGYRYRRYTPTKIYKLAESGIPTIAFNDECVLINTSLISSLRTIDEGLKDILTRLNELASSLPEYETVINMKGVGYTLAPLIIAEIGDIRMYRSKKSLISMAGIDVSPYESGQFRASHRTITKKGNSHIRRHLYLVMTSLIMAKPKTDTAVYDFMTKKKAEGKLDKQAKVAGMRKFLHIYYARVKDKYKDLGIWNKKQ